ncbi:lactoylglutathione lyase [Verticillium alfalfae VaMs.102]|uniref:Aldoketomutase n=1 Tax=Verticillium alfalfae (strain VaMs.102 / ATCC MYA-4576 / FGSC 10136) TaxID=526221 RepID=C9SVW3_VERA1|nr:lactoylglutathione lyase [Verticillium alfalfae VaMs.102]EEY22928.1 lactoylglutathione lyase [Verticillium alfalfae VaMs.102]
MPENHFDLYFLGFDVKGQSYSAGKIRSDRQGLLELTHNYGTELDEGYTISNGNQEPNLGLEHLGITVVTSSAAEPSNFSAGVENRCFNSTGLRIKDPTVSLPWYTDILGMSLLLRSDKQGQTTYWLGYLDGGPSRSVHQREGLVKLIWTHGSELELGKVYHNGNDQPQGFGHLALAVDDITAACEYLESRKVKWKKRLTDGKLKSIAFIIDPDEYWIEIIQNVRIKERWAFSKLRRLNASEEYITLISRRMALK